MTIPNSTYLQKIRDFIINNEILPETTIDFYNDLFLLQEKAVAEFAADQTVPSYIDTSHFPVLQGRFSLDSTTTTRLTLLVKSITLLRNSGEINIDNLMNSLSNNPKTWENIISLLLTHNFHSLRETALEAKTGPEEFLFLIVNALRPFFIHLRTLSMKNDTIGEWTENKCPFCGYIPDMAKIVTSKENRRYLHCPLCEQEWQYKRIGCAICGIEDIQKLAYYEYSDNPVYRFDYCNNCRGYLKTLRIPREHDESRYNLTVENLATSFLDASAIDMGYQRP